MSDACRRKNVALETHNVLKSTLSDRLANHDAHAMSRQRQQRLSPLQEDFIADWITMDDSHGFLPTHAKSER
jgi:hypothetical protein